MGAGRRRARHAAARRRDQRERRLRLPRGRRAGHGGGLPGRGGARGVRRRARLLPRPRALRPPVPRRARRTCCARRWRSSSGRCRRSRAATGTRVAYVKPHGALYNAVVHHEAHARAVVDAIDDLPVVGLPGSARARAGGGRGVCARSRRRSPTAATAPTGRWCRAREPGALVTDAGRRWRRGSCGSRPRAWCRAVDGTDVRGARRVGVRALGHPRRRGAGAVGPAGAGGVGRRASGPSRRRERAAGRGRGTVPEGEGSTHDRRPAGAAVRGRRRARRAARTSPQVRALDDAVRAARGSDPDAATIVDQVPGARTLLLRVRDGRGRRRRSPVGRWWAARDRRRRAADGGPRGRPATSTTTAPTSPTSPG